MTEYDATELSVCSDCIQLLANGEINDGEDTAEKCAAGQARVWGDDVTHLVPGGGSEDDDGDRGFSWQSCDGCGSNLGGDRFQAFAVIPKLTMAAAIRDAVQVARDMGLEDGN